MKKTLFLVMLWCFFAVPAYALGNILILGDSLSAGFGIDIQKSWPVLLQKKLDDENYSYRVVNASVSGSTTDDGKAILPGLLQQHHPNIIVLELGANDGLRGADIEIIRKNLQAMITLSKPYGKVVLIGVHLPPNYGEIYNQRFEDIFSGLAEENNIGLITLSLKDGDNRAQLIQSDGLHPTEIAQPLMMQDVWEGLRGSLSLLSSRQGMAGSRKQGG